MSLPLTTWMIHSDVSSFFYSYIQNSSALISPFTRISIVRLFISDRSHATSDIPSWCRSWPRIQLIGNTSSTPFSHWKCYGSQSKHIRFGTWKIGSFIWTSAIWCLLMCDLTKRWLWLSSFRWFVKFVPLCISCTYYYSYPISSIKLIAKIIHNGTKPT